MKKELSIKEKAIKCMEIEIADLMTSDNEFRKSVELILHDFLIGSDEFIEGIYEQYEEEGCFIEE